MFAIWKKHLTWAVKLRKGNENPLLQDISISILKYAILQSSLSLQLQKITTPVCHERI